MESILLLKEKEVVEKVEKYIAELGWKVLGQVKIRGKYPDIIALKNSKILVIEAKGGVGDVIKGIGQIIHYSSGANYAYLALPKDMVTKDIISALKGVKIGLFEVGEQVIERLKPVERKPLASVLQRILNAPKAKTAKESKVNIPNVIQKSSGLLRTLVKFPEREFTILELSKESKVPYASAWRLVQTLSQLGIILTKTIGKSTVCKLNTASPLLKEIKLLSGLELSPHRAALQQFVNKAKKLKIRKIILFGSVAKGIEKPGSDVDVALIVDRVNAGVENKINEIVDDVLKTSRIKIIPLVFTEKELSARAHFKKEIERGEIIYERS